MRVARPAPPRPAPPLRRRAERWWRAAGPVLALALGLSIALPPPAVAATTWTRNLFASKAFLYQDPYGTTCTAAATMIMLNTVAANDAGGPAFRWSVYRVKHNASDPSDDRDMTSIFAWERKRDTLRSSARGSDAHGWRNALNWYGWGTWQDPATRVYEDRAYRSFGGAVKAAVRAIARYRMPVGVLTWAGGHAQVMHGYTVTGADPAVSNDFTVVAVYLSDPLRSSDIVNRRVSIEKLRSGPLRLRFQRYRETDSPYDDPYSGGWKRSSVKPSRASSEWYGRWVLILPVRAGAVLPEPEPTPDPEPTPPPDPTPTPEPTSDPSTAPTPSLQAGDASLPSPTPEPTTPPTDEPTTPPTDEPTAEPETEPASSEPPTAEPTEPPAEPPAESASPGT